VHVPFCQSKCAYCDFSSLTDSALIPDWLAALEQEASFYQDRFGVFDTLYLGGGTPSLLEAPQITTLITGLRRHFSFSPDTEITLEANPDDLTPGKIKLYKDLGVNRLSLGVQSFHDRELAFLGRRHHARQTVQALEAIRSAGFANLSLDLIYGLPGQTLEAWTQTLEQALSFLPEHLSCYQLTYEPQTPLGRRKARGEVAPATEEEERTFFLFTSRFLEERGFLHYEISNFARLGDAGREPYYSRHNRKYWDHVPYLGLGPAVEQYCRELAQGQTPVAASEILTAAQLRLEALYLGWRTREGVPLDLLTQTPGWENILEELKQAGLVEMRQDRAVPTRQGFLLADHLPLRFMDEGMVEEDMSYQPENAGAPDPWPLTPSPWPLVPDPSSPSAQEDKSPDP
jgi:putative oxygen-independent coproporphyrinogen III oxidase